MKRWAMLVAGLYCLILGVLFLPLTMLGLSENFNEAIKLYLNGVPWAWLLVMGLGQAALLVVPVKLAGRRPVSRRGLLPAILVSGLMMALLAAGAICAFWEFAFPNDNGSFGLWNVIGVMALTWCLWSLIFMRLGRTQSPADLVSRQCRALLRGSVLELLVAVPTHVAVRQRHECCAGFMTFLGLVTGISVMLFSFGPSVFFLFVARWQRLHPKE